jgi:NAD+ synthetase|tara:strand:- start:80 stop:1885 length:1806 start_codon:yes stop_codon:yes gene_type:complete
MSNSEVRPPLRVALVQFKPTKAEVSANVEAIQRTIASQSSSTDLIVFPETSLSGYFLEGGVAESAVTTEELIGLMGSPSDRSPDVVIGFYERWRRRLYNSAVYLEAREGRWKARHVHRKMFLPTYGVFDEARFVEPGTDVQAFETRFGRIGMLICEDMWHSLPAAILALGGAELLVVPSASLARDFSPAGGRSRNLERWEQITSGAALEHGIFVIVAQLVGSEGGKLFFGGSIAVGPDGSFLARGPLLEEAVTLASLDAGSINRSRMASPLLSDLEQMLPHLQRSLESTRPHAVLEDSHAPLENEAQEMVGEGLVGEGPVSDKDLGIIHEAKLNLDLDLVEKTLIEFIRDEVRRRRGFERVVVGVSGGVDSAVSLALACKALGPENVYGFRLPYRTSSQESLEHAALVLDMTQAQTRTIEISDPIDLYVKEYEPGISPLRKGNLMARLRSIILFDQSARLDALPLGTGNKSERLLGYFTWHADDSPPINPLGDLFKTQVWALAQHLGIPEVIIEKPATADLVKGVTDEDEIGVSYHSADPILFGLVSGYSVEELVRGGFKEDEVELVSKRLQATHWKRELPTVAVLSSSAIGEFYLRPVDY